MIRTPLSATDAADRAQFLSLFIRVLIFGLPLLMAGEAAGMGRGWYGGGTLLVIYVLNIPLVFLATGLLFGLMERAASGFTQTVLGGGNIPPDPAHSGYESLVARGFYREAAEAYSAHLVAHPTDNLARVKLAEVHRAHLGAPEAAERLYLEVRRSAQSPREEVLVANLLIELYRATGQRGRLMSELARFAERYRGTRGGAEAARALQEMKRESLGDREG
ncbi:MAG: hypothetical protein IPI38_13660 [Gemmatimonadetes bacterium]|nr:hypothetical protein [Gemmatimonadota bacterium]MBK7716451.1 hypothetical protein [Gemmatimonadota bacterium]MBK7924997.1 hypothetical protein [Gemmatimonadota bacterium]MBK9693180.1 hypothetical protein [Gemmatimonadota bacterium]